MVPPVCLFKTPPTHPMSRLSEDYSTYVIPTYGRFDLDLESGSGSRVVDGAGREYLDFGAGIAVCSLGHAHPGVTEAVARQAATLVHTSNLYRTRPQAELARRLVDLTGPGKVFFCNSGAEANEGLIKLARRFGSSTCRHRIITFQGSFHGRTMACISATGQDKVKKDFGPLLEGFVHVPFGSLEAVREAAADDVVAVLVEPVQGEGGIHVASPDFLRGLRALCDERDMLLLFDEVQCGLGRTGHLRGWDAIAPEVRPDGVSWAKGIANGFPLGAFWVTSQCSDSRGVLCDLLSPGSHGTTYGGNPVACAAGLKVLEVIESEGLLENAVAMGALLADSLRGIDSGWISGVRSIGLMLGVQLNSPTNPFSKPIALEVVARAMDAGLLLIPAGESVVRFLPPLNTTAAEISEAVEKFHSVLKSLPAEAANQSNKS